MGTTRTILPGCPAWCIGHIDDIVQPIVHRSASLYLGEQPQMGVRPVCVFLTEPDRHPMRVQISRFHNDLGDDFSFALPLDLAADTAHAIADGECTLDELAAFTRIDAARWSSIPAEAGTGELADAIRATIRTATDATAHRSDVEAAVSLLQIEDTEFIVTGAPACSVDADPATLTATATIQLGPVTLAFADPVALDAWAKALTAAATDYVGVSAELAAERAIETEKAAR